VESVYTIKLETTELAEGDSVSFNETVIVLDTNGIEGAEIAIYYTLTGNSAVNKLTIMINYNNTTRRTIPTPGTGRIPYKVTPDDADENKVITITAVFEHT
jgi:hypothetical protein